MLTPMAAPLPDRVALHTERALEVGRWATLVAACSAMVSPPLTNAAIVVMLVALLASGQAGVRLRHACTQPLGIGALVLIAVIGIGMLWSPVPWPERWDAFYSWRKLWVVPIALALFGPHVWKQRLIVAYVGVCAVAVLISFGIVIVTGRLPTTVMDLAGKLLRNHSAQSMALAAGTFLALLLAADTALPRRWRLASAAFAALFVLNMAFVTPGRSGLLALAVMLIMLAVLNLRNRRLLVVGGTFGLVLVAAIAVSPLARDRLAVGWSEWRNAAAHEQQSLISPMGIRFVMYENTLELVREHPWLGTGTGGFGAAYAAKVREKYTDWRAMPTVDPHNQYLFSLVEQGMLGLAALLLYIVLALADRGDASRARWAAVGLLLGWCATSMLSSHFKTFAEGHFLALFLGALLARPVPGLDDPGEAKAIAGTA